jgi:hypothetical protein
MSAARKLECFDDERYGCNMVVAAATTRYARRLFGPYLYDLAGRLQSVRNQATATATEPALTLPISNITRGAKPR